MKVFKNLSGLQLGIFALLVCITGVLGYLFYDSYRTNIENRELIADTKIDNKDLSQDLDIFKNKHEQLEKEVELLKAKVKKVTYKKKNYKKRRLYSAGKSSKYKKYYKKHKVSYKKLYYDLKNKCEKKYSYKKSSNKKYSTKSYKNRVKSFVKNNYKPSNYSKYSVEKYNRK